MAIALVNATATNSTSTTQLKPTSISVVPNNIAVFGVYGPSGATWTFASQGVTVGTITTFAREVSSPNALTVGWCKATGTGALQVVANTSPAAEGIMVYAVYSGVDTVANNNF